MHIRHALVSTLSLFAFALAPLWAQDPNGWQTLADLPGVDASGLSAEQKKVLLSVLRTESCNCGCTMKIAECRVKDPRCGRSRSLAMVVEGELREGKTAAAIRADLERRMNEAPPLLDAPVSIPIEGAPVKGPANAKITLVEFSDFQ